MSYNALNTASLTTSYMENKVKIKFKGYPCDSQRPEMPKCSSIEWRITLVHPPIQWSSHVALQSNDEDLCILLWNDLQKY